MDVETTPRPSRAAATLRILSAVLATAVATLLGLVLSLGVWILATDLDKPNPKPLGAAILSVLTLGVAGCVLCLVYRVRAKFTLPCLILCSGLLAFLALDDLHRTPEPDFGPVAAPGSPEYRAYMQMAKGTPDSITSEISLPQNPKELFILAKPEEWDSLLTSHHDQIITEWETDTLGRQWLEDLAALPPTAGAIEHKRIEAPLLAFGPSRAIASRHIAHTLLLARDGHANEASAQLLTLLHACYALERISVGPVDQMIAFVIEKKAYAAARHLLDRGSLNGALSEPLVRALEAAPPVQLKAKRMILGDLQIQRDVTDRIRRNSVMGTLSQQDGKRRNLFPALTCFVFHPYRMERERIEVHTQITARVAARQLDGAQAAIDDYTRFSITWIRNPVGRKLAATATASMEKLGRNLWAAEDERLALLARLQGSSTAAPSAIPPQS